MGLKSCGEGYARKFQPDRRASTMEMMSRVNLNRFPTALARVFLFELPAEWLFIGILEISRADTFVTLHSNDTFVRGVFRYAWTNFNPKFVGHCKRRESVKTMSET